MRLVAAISIIWLHTPQSEALGKIGILGAAAVPFFTFTTIFFAMEAGRKGSGLGFDLYLLRRAKRLYVPFLLWTAIYLLLRMIKSRLLTGATPPMPQLEMAWAGSAHHLWFLPYALVVGAIAFVAARWASRRPGRDILIALAGVGLGIVLFVVPILDWSGWGASEGTAYLLKQVQLKVPCSCWAVAVAAVWRRMPESVRHSRQLGCSGLGMMLLALTGLVAASYAGVALARPVELFRHLGGLGCFLLGMMPWRVPGRLASFQALGRCSFGIYLAHIALIEGLQAVARRCGLSDTAGLDIGVFLLACVMSVAIAYPLSKRAWGQWLSPS